MKLDMTNKKPKTVTKSKNGKKKLSTKPNTPLKELIEFENLLPFGFEFGEPNRENINRLIKQLPPTLQKIVKDHNALAAINYYLKLADTLTILRKAVLHFQSRLELFESQNDDYSSLTIEKRKELIEFNKRSFEGFRRHPIRGQRFLNDSSYATKVKNLLMPDLPSSLTVWAKFTDDYLLVPNYEVVSISNYLSFVLEGIDARRLRICENEKCLKVFWAYRLNQNYCESECQERAKRNRSYHKNKKG